MLVYLSSPVSCAAFNHLESLVDFVHVYLMGRIASQQVIGGFGVFVKTKLACLSLRWNASREKIVDWS